MKHTDPSPSSSPQQITCSHPSINAIDDAVMADDRAWFSRHPTEAVRLRPRVPGEFLIDTLVGGYGQRPVIAPNDWCGNATDPEDFPNTAVVDLMAATGAGGDRAADGGSARIRYPVWHYQPAEAAVIKAAVLETALSSWGHLQEAGRKRKRRPVAPPHRGKPEGFGS